MTQDVSNTGGVSRLDGKHAYHKVSWPSEGVLLLEFNRPPVNAFHDAMWTELKRIIDTASLDPRVRCVVLSSTSDRIFTAGLDLAGQDNLGKPSTLDPARRALQLHEHIIDFQGAISSLSACRVPVIAALHGIALGLAIDIACACDIRLAAEDAMFAIAEVNVGLAADIGTLQRLPKITGNDSLVRELALTGRNFKADEAAQMGFVSRVIKGGRAKVVDEALRMAAEIASKSPIAVISTKHLLDHARDHSVEDGLRYTAAWNMAMLQSEDTGRAMQAVLAKKRIAFPPLARSAKL